MAYIMKDINDAVDEKFLIVKNLKNQAEAGSIIHVMSAGSYPGGITVNYRITATGQNYEVQFKSLGEFFKWARNDTFIARNYNSFSKEDIMRYIKVNSRTFATFSLPLILVSLIIIWLVVILLLKASTVSLIAGAVASVVFSVFFILLYKNQKSKVKMELYQKLSNKWGVKFK